jgi:Domain of unknown function (DUF4252)
MKPIFLLLLASAVVFAQGLDLKSLDSLSAKATDTVDVKLDGKLLQMAATLLSSSDADEGRIKRIVAGLTGVYVKSFEFAKTGEYSETNLESIRAQLGPPNWTRVVTVKSKKEGENSEIFILNAANNQVGGLAIISAEPRELSIVQILGTIHAADIRDLAGNFGIPEKLKKELN